MIKSKKLVILSLVLSFLLVFGGLAGAQEYTMTVSHYTITDTEVSGIAASLLYFENMVETRSDGSIDVKIFGNSSLGGVQEVTRQTVNGDTVQSSIAYGGVFATFFPKYQLMYSPYLFENYRSAWAFMDSDYFAEFMDEARQETGLRHLGIYDDGGGFVAFTNNKRLIKNPEDMEGLRIRTEGGNAAQLAMMEALGAEAVPLPWGDVTTALASGVADGQFNAPYVNAFAKFWEVNDYSSWIKFMFNTAVWSVSDEWFKTLPEKEQNIILTTAEEAIDMARGINAQQSLLDWEKSKEEFEDTYNPPPEVMNEWKETLRPAFYEWVTEDFGIAEEEVDEFWNKAEEISNEVDNKIITNYGVK